MSTVLLKYTNSDELKADEYRYWQSRPVHERLDAPQQIIQAEMILAGYALKGRVIESAVPRPQRPFFRLPCPWR
jgi:hypothetical protein